MKVSIRHDKNVRKGIDATRATWVSNKSIYRNKLAATDVRKAAHKVRVDLVKEKGSPSMVVNYCVRTGESRSIMSKFVRNRHIVRDMARRGKLPGVMKASW